MPLWLSVEEGRAEQEVQQLPPRLQERWKKLKAASRKKTKKGAKGTDHARTFIPSLLQYFLGLLSALNNESGNDEDGKNSSEREARIAYCERFVEWLIDLESQLPTRRFFHLLLSDTHILEKCRLSAFAKRPEGSLFSQLVDMLAAYEKFDVNNFTGEALSVWCIPSNPFTCSLAHQYARYRMNKPRHSTAVVFTRCRKPHSNSSLKV